jgi:hypothetical protein
VVDHVKEAREWLDCYFYSAKSPVSAPYAQGREHIHKLPCECARLASLLARIAREATEAERERCGGLVDVWASRMRGEHGKLLAAAIRKGE